MREPPHPSTQSIPSDNFGYETMSSGSSEQFSDDGTEDHSPVDNDRVAVGNENIQNIIQDYCSRSIGNEDPMVAQNIYVDTCMTTEEWDQEVEFDEVHEQVTVEEEFSIPTELIEGMCFSSKGDLKFALQGWSIRNNVQYIVIASTTKKYTVACAKHDCQPREIIGRMEAKFNIKVSYMKAWDARRKAVKTVFGSWEESYRTLNLFMEAVVSTMPQTVYRIQSNQSNRFQRLFWAFGPSITGWTYCRPVLSLDGTFLLGKYRGTLLSAIGMDANNGLYPLAFAIVESECTESWIWFLRQLNELVPVVTNRQHLCIISDRHAGIVRGCRENFPSAAHKHCLRHLRENFKKAIRRMGLGDVEFICKKMYTAGNTDDIHVYNRCMSDIKKIKVEIHQWLIARWALTHDGGFRYGVMTTNAAESFNGIFLRRLEYITNEEQQSHSYFAPRTQDSLRRVEEESRSMPEPTRLNMHEFQVLDMSSRSYRVDLLDGRTCICSCGKPLLYHMPCVHVVCCVAMLRRSHLDYVTPYYSMTNYKLSYSAEFHHIPNKEQWGEHDPSVGRNPLLPPNFRRRSGRPRTARYRNTMDGPRARSNRVCSACKQAGHNRATCSIRLGRRN
ncbi:hypothetical protein M5K25_002059 [Dendrobium thyrsiflorum]|uniref:SWIM-type domain-containing protein n=1 Tax=Dendrobium thyrsiflorum TaxID=117978 RepID=A0ABD0VS13_DENTH